MHNASFPVLVVANNRERILLIASYLEQLFKVKPEIYTWSEEPYTLPAERRNVHPIILPLGMTVREGILSLQQTYNYKVVVIDSESGIYFTGRQLHAMWDDLDALLMVVPKVIPPVRPDNILMPTRYRLLPGKMMEQLHFLIEHTGIPVEFLHVVLKEETMESLYYTDDDNFADQVTKNFREGTFLFKILKDDHVKVAIRRYISQSTAQRIMGIVHSKAFSLQALLAGHLSEELEKESVVPYFVFNN